MKFYGFASFQSMFELDFANTLSGNLRSSGPLVKAL
jgi:hypothetical protein